MCSCNNLPKLNNRKNGKERRDRSDEKRREGGNTWLVVVVGVAVIGHGVVPCT